MGSLIRCGFLFALTYECHVTYDIPYVSFRTEDDAPPHSLKDSSLSAKVKTMEEKGIGVCSLTRNTLGVEGRVGAPGWGLG
jgi:hypothetical protein